jgi:glycosyltransferase involved in cell wall biosynthesis
VKVLFVGPFPPPSDGIASHIVELGKALNYRAVEVAILTRQSRVIAHQANTQFEVFRILSLSPLTLVKSRRCLAAWNPDVIHYQFNIPALGLLWLWAAIAGAARRRRRPSSVIVVTLHEVPRDVQLLGPIARSIYRLITKYADHVVVYTDEARRILVERCGAMPEKVAQMPHGAPSVLLSSSDDIEARLKSRYGLSVDPVLFLGYIHPDKGIETLIRAFERLRATDPDVAEMSHLVIAGSVRSRRGLFRIFEIRDRRYYRGLQADVVRARLTGLVQFVSYVPDEDLHALLNLVRFAVLPYREVSQSGVLNLLVAARVPVIISDLPGLTETVHEAAMIFEPGNVDALARQIKRLLEDDDQLDAMRRRMAELNETATVGEAASQLITLYSGHQRSQGSKPKTSRRRD